MSENAPRFRGEDARISINGVPVSPVAFSKISIGDAADVVDELYEYVQRRLHLCRQNIALLGDSSRYDVGVKHALESVLAILNQEKE